MREINDLVVRGEAPEVDKLVERIEHDARNGWWKRESQVEEGLKKSRRGRLGVYCYSWQGGEGKPPASLLIYRTGPEELAVSSIVPAARKSLTDQEYNDILASFREAVLGPLAQSLDIQVTITPPRLDRLEQSLSPDAYRKLNRFITGVSEQQDLTMDDRCRWGDFWLQVYSDGSVVDDMDLGNWLRAHGLSDRLTAALLARKDAGQLIAHKDSGF